MLFVFLATRVALNVTSVSLLQYVKNVDSLSTQNGRFDLSIQHAFLFLMKSIHFRLIFNMSFSYLMLFIDVLKGSTRFVNIILSPWLISIISLEDFKQKDITKLYAVCIQIKLLYCVVSYPFLLKNLQWIREEMIARYVVLSYTAVYLCVCVRERGLWWLCVHTCIRE